jgi:glutamate decarboxylase
MPEFELVSRKLRERGWLIPAYTMPPNREELVVLRIVVRNGFSHDMAELFLRDLGAACEWLNDLEGPMPAERAPRCSTTSGLVHRG